MLFPTNVSKVRAGLAFTALGVCTAGLMVNVPGGTSPKSEVPETAPVSGSPAALAAGAVTDFARPADPSRWYADWSLTHEVRPTYEGADHRARLDGDAEAVEDTGRTVDRTERRAQQPRTLPPEGIPQRATVTMPTVEEGRSPSVSGGRVDAGAPPDVLVEDDSVTLRLGRRPSVELPAVDPGTPPSVNEPTVAIE